MRTLNNLLYYVLSFYEPVLVPTRRTCQEVTIHWVASFIRTTIVAPHTSVADNSVYSTENILLCVMALQKHVRRQVQRFATNFSIEFSFVSQPSQSNLNIRKRHN